MSITPEAKPRQVAYAVFGESGHIRCFSQYRNHASLAALENQGHEVITLRPSPLDIPHTEALLIQKAIALCDAVENKEDLPLHKYAMRAGRLVNEVRDLANALSPQQSGSPEGLNQPQQGGDQ